MNAEKLKTKLYEKARGEQDEFRQSLLAMEPGEVLEHAYEYITRKDILMELEENDLSENQCRALLKLERPLSALYEKWLKVEDRHMEDILDTIESYAAGLVRNEHFLAEMDAR